MSVEPILVNIISVRFRMDNGQGYALVLQIFGALFLLAAPLAQSITTDIS